MPTVQGMRHLGSCRVLGVNRSREYCGGKCFTTVVVQDLFHPLSVEKSSVLKKWEMKWRLTLRPDQP